MVLMSNKLMDAHRINENFGPDPLRFAFDANATAAAGRSIGPASATPAASLCFG
jgi:hypothetical protein